MASGEQGSLLVNRCVVGILQQCSLRASCAAKPIETTTNFHDQTENGLPPINAPNNPLSRHSLSTELVRLKLLRIHYMFRHQ